MPHSSGGGSHGGGAHGGSHGGSSGPRISKHYFAGARRYRRHNISTGEDEYIYASSKPSKTRLSSIIFVSIFGALFLGGMGAGMYSELPHKLKAHYLDLPAVHDNINVIEDDEALTDTLTDFQELTGICPVVYTAYIEEWSKDYSTLESYTFDTYTDNFSDEDHFVIVYSISVNDAVLLENGEIDVPDYYWEAVQGDNTDPLLTESEFSKFAGIVQEELERGSDPGRAFDKAFRNMHSRLQSRLTPGMPGYFTYLIGTLIPLIFVGGFFALFLFLNIRQYRKDKNIEYDEVPLDVDPKDPKQVLASAVSGNSHYREFHYDTSSGKKAPLAAKIVLFAVTIPFIVIGLFMSAIGVLMLKVSENPDGKLVIGFGVIWTIFSAFALISNAVAFARASKQAKEPPITAEYPKDEYPDVKSVSQPKDDPVIDQSQFDPQFFNNSRSDIEDDDEDYKRMKRQGFE